MKQKIMCVAVGVLGVGFLAGCFSTGMIGPGSVEGAVPPRLTFNSNKEAVWDNPSSFGPVPASLRAVGDNVCKSASGSRATGYHSRAMNEHGQPFQGGGYYCVKD